MGKKTVLIMKTNSQIRQEARSLMKGNWGDGVIIFMIYSLISGVCSFLFSISIIFVGWPLAFGILMLFLKFVRSEQKLDVSGAFSAFKGPFYWKSIGVYLLSGIFIGLWSLLLIIPGIIKSLSYALAPYILADNPNLSVDEAIEQSMKMMKGHKMDLFLMILGYVGYSLLSILALGIPLLWITPYYYAVFAKFYDEVKKDFQLAV